MTHLFRLWFMAALALRLAKGFSRPFCSRAVRGGGEMAITRTRTDTATTPSMMSAGTTETITITNPLLQDWSSRPFHLPPFQEIDIQDYQPALEHAMKAHLEDLQAIIDDPEEPTFENTVQAYDQAGHVLDKVSGVFSNMCSSMNTEELQKVQTEMSPILSRHRSKASTLPGLFDKILQVYQTRQDRSEDDQQANANNNKSSSNWTPEQLRLVERIHMDFVRSGAQLDKQAQDELTEIKAQMATLRTQFQQNVLKDESDYELCVTLQDLEGCPESLVQAAKQAAVERNKHNDGDKDKDGDAYLITLSRSLVEPFLVFCNNRELRREAWDAWTQRGQSSSRDNIPIAQEILKLRQRQAQLYGYKTFAEFQCVDRMAKSPENVMKLLEDVWERAKVSADRERQALEEHVAESGMELPGGIQPWDWRHVAEKVRKAKYDFDETLLKPYLSLDSVRTAMFAVSGNLFGLTYTLRPDLPTYHPDVDAYEVRNKDDQLVSIFLHDNFSRPFKGSGAWMSEYRSQTKNLGGLDAMEGIPIVSNNNNFAKGSGATLLSHDGT
jgi:peptidyl-dipeptidase Dcp